MRSPDIIKAEIEALSKEYNDAENHWQRAQYREVVLDELDACKSLDDVKRFLASSLVDMMVEEYGHQLGGGNNAL